MAANFLETRDNNIYTWAMHSTNSRVISRTCLCHSGVMKYSLTRNAVKWKQTIMFLWYADDALNFQKLLRTGDESSYFFSKFCLHLASDIFFLSSLHLAGTTGEWVLPEQHLWGRCTAKIQSSITEIRRPIFDCRPKLWKAACTKTRNNETKRPKRNHRNERKERNTETKAPKRPKPPKRPKRKHRNDRNETTETAETKPPKRNDQTETTKMKTNTTNMIGNDRNKTTCERKTELFYM